MLQISRLMTIPNLDAVSFELYSDCGILMSMSRIAKTEDPTPAIN